MSLVSSIFRYSLSVPATIVSLNLWHCDGVCLRRSSFVCVARFRCPYAVSGSDINIAVIDFQDSYCGPYILLHFSFHFLFVSIFPNLLPRRLTAAGFKSERAVLVLRSAPVHHLQIEHEAIYDAVAFESLWRPPLWATLGTINSITPTSLVSHFLFTLLNMNAPRLQRNFLSNRTLLRLPHCDTLNLNSPYVRITQLRCKYYGYHK
jgi:hypothetical protein